MVSSAASAAAVKSKSRKAVQPANDGKREFSLSSDFEAKFLRLVDIGGLNKLTLQTRWFSSSPWGSEMSSLAVFAFHSVGCDPG